MKFFSFCLAASVLWLTTTWETDFERALQRSHREHKPVLLRFSGSDWCIPCIRMQKEIFENPAFASYADTSLILFNADFPRLKKNQLPKERQQQNNKLADRYNKNGVFPLTLLVDENGKVLKTWEGYVKETPEEFTAQLKSIADAARK